MSVVSLRFYCRFLFLVFPYFFFVSVPCARLSWRFVSFWARVNISYRICSDHAACDVSVVAVADAELDELSVDDVVQTEDVIVSQWRDVSADERHEMREKVDEMLLPLGFETSLLVIRRANSLALFLLCMTLSAVTSLRDHCRTRRLRDIIQSLFTFLSGNTYDDGDTRTVRVKRLTWPLTDYERCLQFFHSLQGKQTILS